MKIVFIAPRFHTNLFFFIKFLQESSLSVNFLCSYSLKNIENYDDINPLRMNYFKSVIYLIKNKPDLVIIRGRSMRAMLYSIVCKILSIKSLGYEQVVLENKESIIHRKIFLFNLISSAQNLFLPKYLITPIAKNRNISFSEQLKLKRFYLPLPIQANQMKKFNSSKIKILMVGKFESRKRHRLLFDAIEMLRNGCEIELTCIGLSLDSYFDKVLELSKKYSFKIILMKNVPHEKILKEYGKFDVFVLPSVAEEFAYSPFEAMSYGVPVIIGSDQGNKYHIDGKNGLIFKSDDMYDLSEKIKFLISNKKRLAYFGKKGYDYVKNELCRDKFIKKFQRIVDCV